MEYGIKNILVAVIQIFYYFVRFKTNEFDGVIDTVAVIVDIVTAVIFLRSRYYRYELCYSF